MASEYLMYLNQCQLIRQSHTYARTRRGSGADLAGFEGQVWDLVKREIWELEVRVRESGSLGESLCRLSVSRKGYADTVVYARCRGGRQCAIRRARDDSERDGLGERAEER